MHVLFITEKYQYTDQVTNNMWNLIGSYKCANIGTYEHYFTHPTDIQNARQLDELLDRKSYDIAVISVERFLPSTSLLNRLGHKIVFFWWDTVYENRILLMKSWEPYARQVCFDWGCGKESDNVWGLEVPQDTTVFYRDDSVPEDIDISFVGTISDHRRDRQQIIEKLKAHGYNIWSGGGRDIDNFPIEQYASIFRRSKICLNFSLAFHHPQRKGRAFEIAACGQCMFSNYPETFYGKEGCFFSDGEDYVSFDADNVIERVDYYLQHEEERNQISDNMYRKYLRNYSPLHFWKKVIAICAKPKDRKMFL